MNNENFSNDPLMEMAKERVAFKRHAVVYILVNLFLWVLYFWGDGDRSYSHGRFDIPWPLFTMFGWGIGLGSHYFKAYKGNNDAVQKEYEKLKQEEQNKK
jgi:hypothetical protein